MQKQGKILRMENSGSNGLKKSMQVCRYLFQNRFWTWNTAMVYILLFICISYHVRPIAGFCLDQKIAVTPWIFPFVTSDFMLQILVCAGAVFLLADAPFHNENRLPMHILIVLCVDSLFKCLSAISRYFFRH